MQKINPPGAIKLILSTYVDVVKSLNEGMEQLGQSEKLKIKVGPFEITEKGVSVVADAKISISVDLSVDETQSNETASSKE